MSCDVPYVSYACCAESQERPFHWGPQVYPHETGSPREGFTPRSGTQMSNSHYNPLRNKSSPNLMSTQWYLNNWHIRFPPPLFSISPPHLPSQPPSPLVAAVSEAVGSHRPSEHSPSHPHLQRHSSSGSVMLDQLLSDIQNKFVTYAEEVRTLCTQYLEPVGKRLQCSWNFRERERFGEFWGIVALREACRKND